MLTSTKTFGTINPLQNNRSEIFNQTEGDFDVFMADGTGYNFWNWRLPQNSYARSQVIGVDYEGSIVAHYAKTGEMGG